MGANNSDDDYLIYAHDLNVRNIKLFSLAICAICLLLLTDTSGPNPAVKYNHIFNSDNISILFLFVFAIIWLCLRFTQNSKIQKIVTWCCVVSAYLFSDGLSYLNLSNGSSVTSFAVAYLMISFLIAEKLRYLLLIMLLNGLLFSGLAVFVGEIEMAGFRIALISIIFLSILVAITMDKQRRNVFFSQMKIEQQVRELNNALDVKAAFFGHMSHELRTPLNAIIGFSDMLKTMAKNNPDPKKVAEYAEYINSGGNHLLSLVNDLLDQNKLEAGVINIEIETIDVETELKSYIEELKPISKSKNQKVSFHLSDENIKIHSDRRAFKQIIYNLLSNAQKYTPENGTITIMALWKGKENIEVIIKDNGKGMPAEVIELINNSNVPLKSHYISQAEGAGLGMIIVRQLIYRIGATINIKTELGIGTEITLSFPVDQ